MEVNPGAVGDEMLAGRAMLVHRRPRFSDRQQLVVFAIALLFTLVLVWMDRTFVNHPVLQPWQGLG